MDGKSFKKLLDEAIVPITKDLAEIKSTQTQLQGTVSGLQGSVNELQGSVSGLQGTVTEMKDTLDNRVLPSVTETEIVLKSYVDSYKINRHNIERLDSRLSTVEDKLDVKPAEDLKVPHFAE